MKIDRQQFFDGYRSQIGSLKQSQVDGLNQLLDSIEADAELNKDVRWVAYAMATYYHEAAATWQPIAEYGKGKGRPYGKPINGKVYFGRGACQLTWAANYQKMTTAWNVYHPNDPADFVKNPDLMLQHKYAYFALSYGMRYGVYTGKALKDYIAGDKCDYTNARRIINGTDKALMVANYARTFESILRKSEVVA